MHINYDLVRAVEKITKGLEREEGLGIELLGRYGLDVSGASIPQSPNIRKGTNRQPEDNEIRI